MDGCLVMKIRAEGTSPRPKLIYRVNRFPFFLSFTLLYFLHLPFVSSVFISSQCQCPMLVLSLSPSPPSPPLCLSFSLSPCPSLPLSLSLSLFPSLPLHFVIVVSAAGSFFVVFLPPFLPSAALSLFALLRARTPRRRSVTRRAATSLLSVGLGA